MNAASNGDGAPDGKPPTPFPPPPGSGATIYRGSLAGIDIRILDGHDLRWLTAGGDGVQSAYRPSTPERLLLANHHYMLTALGHVHAPAQLLNLGLGGGAFERLLHARLPHIAVQSVEHEAGMVKLAREYFALPCAATVAITEAYAYLRESSATYEIILCDIFTGEDQAGCLTEADFYACAAARLQAGGMLAVNLAPANENALLECLVVMRSHFPHIQLVQVAGHSNVVVLLSQGAPPDPATLGRRLARLDDRLGTTLAALAADFTVVPVSSP